MLSIFKRPRLVSEFRATHLTCLNLYLRFCASKQVMPPKRKLTTSQVENGASTVPTSPKKAKSETKKTKSVPEAVPVKRTLRPKLPAKEPDDLKVEKNGKAKEEPKVAKKTKAPATKAAKAKVSKKENKVEEAASDSDMDEPVVEKTKAAKKPKAAITKKVTKKAKENIAKEANEMDESEGESDDEDFEKKPVKKAKEPAKKKGRKPKAKEDEDEPIEDDKPEKKPVEKAEPKKKGRKPKPKQEDDEEEPMEVDKIEKKETEAAEPKKKGRKAKPKAEDDADEPLEEKNESETAEPKKRGRKAKPKIEDDVEEPIEDDKSEKKEVETAEPKKKSRKPKEKPDDEAEETAVVEKPAKEPSKLMNQSTTDWEKIDFSCTRQNNEGNEFNMKICSWNVGGLRSCVGKGGLQLLEHEQPDIICLQETKCTDDKMPNEVLEIAGYKMYWCHSKKDGYAGVGLFSKVEPISVQYGIGIEEHDDEGRCLTAEYENFHVVCVYVPNAGKQLVTLPKRLKWNEEFKAFVQELDKKKPVIICGDMNVAHNEIDLKNPKTNKKNAGFTQEERDGLTDFLGCGFVDSYRSLYPDKSDVYTFWTYMANARAKNTGWRLDYFLLSDRIKDKVCDVLVRNEVFGSDHCPITLFINM